ncbi:hypothetical protein EHS13_25860 [Paenibacillus psychroresistens]|uniref:Uncharacterized protein n=1 Tax=Paenibacillus psychroresistens TaxID=1778678 RepID=A0A6B8RWY1_9BACL|nr:hypothetical protein EHS13_25860 [Paenibacillus psychroresistens]
MGVAVGTAVATGVALGVATGVATGVGVGVGVAGVGVDPPPLLSTYTVTVRMTSIAVFPTESLTL